MATATAPVPSRNQEIKQKAQDKALEKEKIAASQEVVDTISDGFKAIMGSMTSLEKTVKAQSPYLKRVADSTGKISRASAEMSARLWTLIKDERERENGISTIRLVDKQFEFFESSMTKTNTKLERIADHVDMTSSRLWTLIKNERDREDSHKKQVSTVELNDKQWNGINDRLKRIATYTDASMERAWTLLRWTQENALSKTNMFTLLDTMVQRHLIDLKDVIEMGTNRKGELNSNTFDKGLLQLSATMTKWFTVLVKQNGLIIKALNKHSTLLAKPHTTIIREPRPERPAEPQDGHDEKPDTWLKKFSKEFDKDWKNFSDSFMNVFERGVIGKLAGLNPLISLAVDMIGSVATTIKDIGGTFWHTYLLFARLWKSRATMGSGLNKTKDNAKDTLGNITSFFKDNFGSVLSTIGTFSKGLGVLRGGIATLFGGIAFSATSLIQAFKGADGVRAGLNGLFDAFKGLKSVKLFTKFAYLKNIFESFFDFGDFLKGGIFGSSLGDYIQGAIAAATRIAFTGLEVLIDLIVDIPTMLVSKLAGWLGFDKVASFLNQDFSKLIIDTAMTGIKGILQFFDAGLVEGASTLFDFVKFFLFGWPIEMLTDVFKSGWALVGDSVTKWFYSIMDWLPDFMLSDSMKKSIADSKTTTVSTQQPDKMPAINANNTKELMEQKADLAANNSVTVVTQQNNIASTQAAPQAVPTGALPAYNNERTWYDFA